MNGRCPQCGEAVATASDLIDGLADYAETQGGHNDRHTLIVEAAERIIESESA